jgi:hypothetical protein
VRLLRHVEVDARAVARFELVQLAVGVFHGVDAGLHIEDLFDLFVGEKNHYEGPFVKAVVVIAGHTRIVRDAVASSCRQYPTNLLASEIIAIRLSIKPFLVLARGLFTA